MHRIRRASTPIDQLLEWQWTSSTMCASDMARHTNHAKDGSKDIIDEDVGKRANRRRASTHESGSCGTGTAGIRNKGRGGAVEVATALELDPMLVSHMRTFPRQNTIRIGIKQKKREEKGKWERN